MRDDPSDAVVIRALRSAGVTAAHSDPALLGTGFDNAAYAVATDDGRDLVVRVRNANRSRYRVARHTGERLAAIGVPVPVVLWHDEDTCVETRLPGIRLDSPTISNHAKQNAAGQAGTIMRRWHELQVRGFGPLDLCGAGRHASWTSWLLDLPRPPTDDGGGVERRARRALEIFARRPAPEPRLLHGDLVARHIMVSADTVTGIIDLDSARAGDPLTEIAGWTLREPPELTEALARTYFAVPPDAAALTTIVMYRLRIAISLYAFHHRRGDLTSSRSLVRCLAGDLADLEAGTPRLVPATRLTPRNPLHGGSR